jgi:hypothetical protein
LESQVLVNQSKDLKMIPACIHRTQGFWSHPRSTPVFVRVLTATYCNTVTLTVLVLFSGNTLSTAIRAVVFPL